MKSVTVKRLPATEGRLISQETVGAGGQAGGDKKMLPLLKNKNRGKRRRKGRTCPPPHPATLQ